jgi:2-phosphosulfolactate phosphatase
MWFSQAGYDVRADWGSDGLAALLDTSAVVVIVDVLCFSTCVDVAVDRGALVAPVAEAGEVAEALASGLGAVCAGPRGRGGFSLSPQSFACADPGARIVLPSPNGAALSLGTSSVPTFTACLRNATAVARAVERLGRPVTVIAAGERWPSGRLRPALEDWLGVGAVVRARSARASATTGAALRVDGGVVRAIV